MTKLKLLPYTSDDPKIKTTFLRLLVQPVSKSETTTSDALIIPGSVGEICQTGIIHATCEGSTMQPGDTILYKKVDRNTSEHLDTISIEGKKYDVLYENEVWAVNNHPFNLVFIQDVSDMSVSEDGLLLPASVRGITAKGKVFRAPSHYSVKAGDEIEYRKQDRDIYPTINIEGQNYLVLHEADIFIVNGKVAPYRIIVKVDIAAQKVKRHTTATGLVRSPLFTGMLHNMQVGEVVEIGASAHENFPELKVGDQAIMHHRVEHQDYRLVGREYAKADKNVVTYEYRVLECFDVNNRDLMGRVVNRKTQIFASFGKNVFLEWNFELLNKNSANAGSLILDFDTNLDKCTNIDDLTVTIKHKQTEGFDKAVAKRKGIIKSLSECELPRDKERFDALESRLKESEQESVKIGNYVNGNHLVVCTKLGSKEKVIATYKELYPINIFGKKFLIGYEDFLEAVVENTLVAGTEAVT